MSNQSNDSKEKKKVIIEPISLLGHSVRVEDPYLLQFFYPNLKFLDNPKDYVSGMNDFIYTGDYKAVGKFKQLGLNFIATNVPVYEYDLTDSEQLLKFVYSRFKKEVPKYFYTKNVLNSMSYDECVIYSKMFWVSGKWYGPSESDADEIFSFFLSISNDAYLTIIANYFKLDFDITSSLLTFLFNVITKGDSKDGKYKELLIRVGNQFGNKIRPAVYNYLKSSINDQQLRTFYLLMDIIAPS